MMRHVALSALLLLPLLAACVPAPEDDGFAPPPETCPAADYEGLVGSSLAAVTLPAGLNMRIIGPDTAVTLEIIDSRINFFVDDDGIVTSVSCG